VVGGGQLPEQAAQGPDVLQQFPHGEVEFDDVDAAE